MAQARRWYHMVRPAVYCIRALSDVGAGPCTLWKSFSVRRYTTQPHKCLIRTFAACHAAYYYLVRTFTSFKSLTLISIDTGVKRLQPREVSALSVVRRPSAIVIMRLRSSA